MASVKVVLPMSSKVKPPLENWTVQANTVFEAVQAVVETYPELRPRFFVTDEHLTGSLILFLNDEQVEHEEVHELVVHDGDVLELMFALAGGEPTPAFSRYARQITLEQVGIEGQKKLGSSKVLLVGAGGLGVPAATYLAAAGIGSIGLVDGDVIDITNLARQVLYSEEDVGQLKVDVAVNQLRRINPHVKYQTYAQMLSVENAFEILKDYDVVINCTDNFGTRYLINEICVALRIPFIDAAAVEFYGHLAVFLPGQGCYQCLFPEPDQESELTCGAVGVFSPLVGYFGTLSAIEAMKVLLGIATPQRLHVYNALTGEHKNMKWKPRKKCPVCAQTHDPELVQNVLVQERQVDTISVSAQEFLKWIAEKQFVLVDVRDDEEMEIDVESISRLSASYVRIPFALFEYDFPFDRYRNEETLLLCICNKGIRSRFATYLMRENGLKNSFQLNGGLLGLPVDWQDFVLAMAEDAVR